MDQTLGYPVLETIPELRHALGNNSAAILQAPPGAGKSTVVPLHLLNEPWLAGKKIIMLEPRRLAARAVAMRMAQLHGSPIGKTIGYRVRFDNQVGPDTRIEVVTEGILTRMIQGDNSLESVGLIIFDEFHERSLQADLALALSTQVQQILRDDLKLLIMSATLDGEKLSSLLSAPIITSQGRQFPVDIKYDAAVDNSPLPIQVARTIKKALRENEGDILAFLPGAGEINRVSEILLNDQVSAHVMPLYGDLSFARQQEAILPHPGGARKVVLATSIAETSLTIEGITVVIDSGFSRVPKFDPRSGLSRLETVRVTIDAADQRAGRAGRLKPGVCYRLWTRGIHLGLKPNRIPEIIEADLAPIMLELFQWGIKDVMELNWITPPPRGNVGQAIQLLEDLEAIDQGALTDHGKKMVQLPTHPRLAHMLVTAKDSEKAAAADLAAILEERDPLPRDSGADLTLRLHALDQWRKREPVHAERAVLERIEKLSLQWRKLLNVDTVKYNVNDVGIGELVMAAYPERIARQLQAHGERFKLLNNRIALLPKNDPLTREPWLAIAQMDAGAGDGKIFLAAPVHENELRQHARDVRAVRWDDDRGMIEAVLEKRVGGLVLTSKPAGNISEDERLRTLAAMIRDKGLRVLGWDETLVAWQNRIMSLRAWRPDESWPNVSEEALLEKIEIWLGPFITHISKLSELQKLDAHSILSTVLPWELQSSLDRLAPERIEVPSGSNIRVNYSASADAPTMEVRLQEIFGLLKTPTVNEGRTKVVMHLLSPGFKPVQVTQDLHSFWSSTYAEVRKELRTRYPKHSWPEDPWTAQAVRGAKRRT